MDQQEVIKTVEEVLYQPLIFNTEIKISKIKNKDVNIIVPPEIRLTQNLLNYITLALKERGLELSHMDITEEHRKELESLTNVVVQNQKNE